MKIDEEMAVLSLGVFAMAGFGVEEEEPVILPYYTYTFKESLKVVLEKAIELSLLPRFLLPKYMVAARCDFSRYLKSLVGKGVQSPDRRPIQENGALLAALIRENHTYETLRIYGVVDSVIRHTVEYTVFDFTDVIHLDPQLPAQIEIPPNIHTIPVIGSLHTHPFYWGVNSLDFDPGRWVKLDNGIMPLAEVLKNPAPKDTFFPWSGGLLACIGKKFSQVEFVATISRILHDRWIVPISREGEDEFAIRKRVLSVLEDVELSPGRKMVDPQKVPLRFPKVQLGN
ncbi:hypothetical protein ABW20_dc0103274 [Dactylellina cionopaga]|nr:hypothetical protein ABW20_dc0103274 [Dactylellina cionopaga]